MRLSEPELRALHQESLASSECLSEDLLLRAGRGRLNDSERDQVAAHLGSCASCARAYQAAFVMRELDAEPVRRGPWLALAAAAAFLLPVFGLIRTSMIHERDTRTIAALESRLDEAERKPARTTERIVTIAEPPRPRLNMPIVDLDPDVTRGTSAAPAAIEATDVFTLILHLDRPVRGSVPVSIEDASGAVVWKESWPAPSRSATLTLTLDKKQFGAGRYHVRVGDNGFHFHVR